MHFIEHSYSNILIHFYSTFDASFLKSSFHIFKTDVFDDNSVTLFQPFFFQ